MLTPEQALAALPVLLKHHASELTRLDRIDAYLRGVQEQPYKPKTPNDEYRKLAARATTNYLPLIVSTQQQQLQVEGYRSADDGTSLAAWGCWQANGFDRRQGPVIRAALEHGLSYVVVLPGTPRAVMRGVSARRMIAVYDDPVADDWPVMALEVGRTMPNGEQTLRLYDEVQVHTVVHRTRHDDGAQRFEHQRVGQHALGVCPVVRFASGIDLEGRSIGEVEPLIPQQDRINQTTFDLLMAQTFGAFNVRAFAGTSSDDDELGEDATAEDRAAAEQARRARQFELSVDRFLELPDGATLQQLSGTPLDPFINAFDSAVRSLIAVSQTAPHHLLGQQVNLSAEALAAAEAGSMRKGDAHQHEFGEAWEQVLRLSARAENSEDPGDSGQVVWRDLGSRSLAQTADALTKLASPQGLAMPREFLWSKVPGVTQTDVVELKRLAREADSTAALAMVIGSAEAGPIDPTEIKAKADALGVLIRAGATFESAAAIVGLAGLQGTGAVPTTLRQPESAAGALEEV